jgi:hypothetical protein
VLIVSAAIGGMLSGCFSSTKEVDMVPAAAPIVQVSPLLYKFQPPSKSQQFHPPS